MAINLGFLSRLNVFSETFILSKELGGHYNEYDEYVSDSEETFKLIGSVEALSGISRTNDESGERSHEQIKITTDRSIVARALKQGDMIAKGDLIRYRDTTYRVENVYDWTAHGFITMIAFSLNGADVS